MRSKHRRLEFLLMSALALALSAGPGRAQTDPADPWEPANRKFYAVHQVIDHWVLAPAAHAYAHLPKPLRKSMHNFSTNLSEPGVMVNDLLQGHVGTAASTLGRFAINTTVGVGGVFDVAKRGRIPHHDNGFGTTLGRWGAKPGPYMFVPVLGPTDVRDALGGIVNIFLSPYYYLDYSGRTQVSVITTVSGGMEKRLDAQQALDTIRETSTDPYATLRSYFQQNREADIHGANNPNNLPDFETPDIQSQPQGAQTTAPDNNLPPLPDIESEPEPSATPQSEPEAQPEASPAAPAVPPAAGEPATPAAPPPASTPAPAPPPATPGP